VAVVPAVWRAARRLDDDEVEGFGIRRGADVLRDPADVARQDVLVGGGPDRVVEQRHLRLLDEGLDAAGHHAPRGRLRRYVLLAGHPERRDQRGDHQQDDPEQGERQLPREGHGHLAVWRAHCAVLPQAQSPRISQGLAARPRLKPR
jgi:hypothetical protein